MLGRECVVLRAKSAGLCYTMRMHTRSGSFGRWWKTEWSWLSYLVVFGISFSLLLLFQANTIFADPDSFYHAKMALLMRDSGIVHSFPWLQLTTLGQHYTDQHFLYHVILIPFETWLSPLMGLKLATVVFGASLLTVFYWFLRTFHIRWAFFYFLLLLFSRPFIFRISLAKAPSTSLILLLVGLAWVFRFQIKRAAILAFLYVWYYGGFPLFGVVTAAYAAVSALYNRVHRRMSSHRLVANILALVRRPMRRQRLNPNWAIVFAVVGGLAAGVIFNPYFPHNLFFYWQQLVNIGIINFRDVIGVGAEWYPYGFLALATNAAFVSLLLLVSVVAIIFRARQMTKQTWALLLLTIFFMVLTLKSRRYVEYFVPIAMLYGAFAINDAVSGPRGEELLRAGRRLIFASTWSKAIAGILAIYLLSGIGYIAGRDTVGQITDLRSGFPMTKFQAVGTWMSQNTPVGSRVVHSDWDEFPPLFYYDSHNTYIAGLDPTFLYKANEDDYWTWVNITLGKYSGDVHEAVTKKLGAQYVFIAQGHTGMENEIQSDGRFTLVYRDDEATVYQAE